MKRIFTLLLCLSGSLLWVVTQAQEQLYPNEFALSDLRLLESPFKHAQELNVRVLLEYDLDRLLAPYRKEAGLPEKAKSFPNWLGLDGHIGGHYLSALAMNFASSGNLECKARMDTVIAELKLCQQANGQNYPDWGVGYVGGVPNSDKVWASFKRGDFTAFHTAWVPWYNVHKMYAGLRDAWLYAHNSDAKLVFLKFCDWGVAITASLTDEQMQTMLDTEHGGMNEIFADAYQMTKDVKYLAAARRFSHNMLLDSMAAQTDNLDNKHANTQVPKVIGFQRIAELSGDSKYATAGRFFWETVTEKRSLAFGGNSRRESFPSATSCTDFVTEAEGPESCNTYNMLKLTEDLFRVKPLALYADYFERAMFNHILSTQNPEHGGFVYFTPARPRHYRVYSAPNEAMWCCVGSGMENHGKYAQFIYTHRQDSLFLNLFVASELKWKEKGITVTQETKFPYEEKTQLRFSGKSSKFTLLVRYPVWVKENGLKIFVNGKAVSYIARPSAYVAIKRKWKNGDKVEILLPMHTTIEHLPNVPNYIALLHGPILLGAKTGTENLNGLVANDGRWGHIAGGERLPIDKATIIVEDNLQDIENKLVPVDGKALSYTMGGLKLVNAQPLVLEPFSEIHDSRYSIYWLALSNDKYRAYLDSLAALEVEKLALQTRTVDFVAPGEQQPEADHFMQKENSNTGNLEDEFWRDAANEGYFSYQMSTNAEENLTLMVRYWGAEWGNRKFDILIDDQRLVSVDNTFKWNQSKFQDVEYAVPNTMVEGKKQIRLKFQSTTGNSVSSVFYVRLIRNKKQ